MMDSSVYGQKGTGNIMLALQEAVLTLTWATSTACSSQSKD
jgi:hypothetical protein